MKAYTGNKGIALLILIRGARRSWVFSVRPQTLYLKERTWVPILQNTRPATELVRTFGKEKNLFPLKGFELLLFGPYSGLVLSMLSWFSRPQISSSVVFYSLVSGWSLLISRLVKAFCWRVPLYSLRFIVTACHKLILPWKFPLLRKIRTIVSSQFYVCPM